MRRKASEIPSRELNIGGISVTLEYRKGKKYQSLYQAARWKSVGDGASSGRCFQHPEISGKQGSVDPEKSGESTQGFLDVSRGEGAGKGKGAGRRISPEEQEILLARVLFYARRWEPVLKVHAKKWILREMKPGGEAVRWIPEGSGSIQGLPCIRRNVWSM